MNVACEREVFIFCADASDIPLLRSFYFKREIRKRGENPVSFVIEASPNAQHRKETVHPTQYAYPLPRLWGGEIGTHVKRYPDCFFLCAFENWRFSITGESTNTLSKICNDKTFRRLSA